MGAGNINIGGTGALACFQNIYPDPVAFLVIFGVVGKSALMEMIPLALIEVFLFVVNFTPAVKVQENTEVDKAMK